MARNAYKGRKGRMTTYAELIRLGIIPDDNSTPISSQSQVVRVVNLKGWATDKVSQVRHN